MSGLEANLKSTRPRPGHYETKAETEIETETETLKIGLETETCLKTFITVVNTAKQGKVS